MSAFDDPDCFGGEADLPFVGGDVQDANRAARAEPRICHLLEVLETMDDISLGILVRQVEDVDGAGRVGHVDDNVADLPQSIAAFIDPEQLGYGRSSLGAHLPGRHMCRERSAGLGILEERAV